MLITGSSQRRCMHAAQTNIRHCADTTRMLSNIYIYIYGRVDVVSCEQILNLLFKSNRQKTHPGSRWGLRATVVRTMASHGMQCYIATRVLYETKRAVEWIWIVQLWLWVFVVVVVSSVVAHLEPLWPIWRPSPQRKLINPSNLGRN